MNSQRLLNGATIGMTALAIASAARALWRPRQPSGMPAPVAVADWIGYASQGLSLGARDAPVTVTVFSDFQCPYCRAFAQSFRQASAERPGRVRLVFRQFPLTSLHSSALRAASAAICAAHQGRFAAMHYALFDKQDFIGTKSFESFAADAGIEDLEAFTRCTTDAGTDSLIGLDMKAGNRLGATGTPTILVNGLMIRGNPGKPLLDSLIDHARPIRGSQ